MSEPNENVICESTANDIATGSEKVEVIESANEGADIVAEDVAPAHLMKRHLKNAVLLR